MGTAPLVSVILPVLNEPDTINRFILDLQEIASGGLVEVIVVDGDLRGGTINAITVEGVRTAVAEKGRARQMNCGAALATGEMLLFLHADTHLPTKAFSLIREAMDDIRCVAGAFDLGIHSPRKIFKITEIYVFLRTRLTRVPFGDQAIFIRRAYFEKIGGYGDIPLMEDVELMRGIRRRGDRICIIPVKVRTSSRRWEREGILCCTFRNWMLQLLYWMGMPPARLTKWYNR